MESWEIKMAEITLSKSLYNGFRISIDLFTYLPRVDYVKGYEHNLLIHAHPILMIKYVPPKSLQNIDRKNNFFKITPRNLYRTIKFFDEIVKWFYDKDLADLFLQGDDNKLVFNADYQHIKARTKPDKHNQTAMRAIPAVISSDDGKTYEGIYLYINKMENVVPLTLSEVEDILGLLAKFSFEESLLLMLEAYDYAARNNLIREQSLYNDTNGNQW